MANTKTIVAKSLLTPDNCTIIFIDHQAQTTFGVQSIDRQELINNVDGLAKAAMLFNVPTILTTVADGTFTGPILNEIQEAFRITTNRPLCIVANRIAY